MSKLTPDISFDFRGHSVLVTGATGGIGSAVADGCAAAGANVVLHGRDETETKPIRERCQAHGVRASVIPADFFGDMQQIIPAFVDMVLAAEPDLDMAVFCAGGCIHYGPVEDMTFEQYDQLMKLNVSSIYFTVQHLVRHWQSKKVQGRVVIVGSINGRLAESLSSMYDTAKGAVEMMVRSFAAELSSQGIRVNGMAPGMVRTAFTKWIDDRPNDGAWIALHTPSHNIPGPESCVGPTMFLLSDAADHIQGHMLMVDGGMAAWQHPNRPPSLAIPWSVLGDPIGSLKDIPPLS